MKYRIVAFIILFPLFGIGQTKISVDTAKLTLADLMDSWGLGIDSNSDVADIRVYNKFKSLFDLNATIEDDLNASYHYENKRSGAYTLDKKPKAFDVYAHDAALQVKGISFDSIAVLSWKIPGENTITFTIKRNIDFQKTGKFVLPEDYVARVISSRPEIEFHEDSDRVKMADNLTSKVNINRESVYTFTVRELLHVTMVLKRDTFRITNIQSSINDFKCNNDYDHDAVPDKDEEDPAKIEFGDFTAKGRSDYDLDGVPDGKDKCETTFGEAANQGCPPSYFVTKNKLDGFIGLQMNAAKLSLPELNELGYTDPSGNDLTDVLQSKKGVLKNPANVASIYAGGNFTYYFGQKRKRSGISVGLTYSGFTAAYQLAEPVVYTFKSSDGINFYRRQITLSSLKENITYNIFSLPLMLNYRMHLDRKNKSVLSLRTGPSLMLFNNTSAYNAVIDFGGLYQIDTVQKNNITYYDHFDRGSTFNIFFTSDSINSANAGPGADVIFGQLGAANYDFASHKNYSGKSGNLQRITAAFNLYLNVQHKISQGLTIELGTHFVYAPLVKGKERYKPIDRTTDEFQSIYTSNVKSTYSALGVNIGLVYDF